MPYCSVDKAVNLVVSVNILELNKDLAAGNVMVSYAIVLIAYSVLDANIFYLVASRNT